MKSTRVFYVICCYILLIKDCTLEEETNWKVRWVSTRWRSTWSTLRAGLQVKIGKVKWRLVKSTSPLTILRFSKVSRKGRQFIGYQCLAPRFWFWFAELTAISNVWAALTNSTHRLLCATRCKRQSDGQQTAVRRPAEGQQLTLHVLSSSPTQCLTQCDDPVRWAMQRAA